LTQELDAGLKQTQVAAEVVDEQGRHALPLLGQE
jgi:hypothetical protein